MLDGDQRAEELFQLPLHGFDPLSSRSRPLIQHLHHLDDISAGHLHQRVFIALLRYKQTHLRTSHSGKPARQKFSVLRLLFQSDLLGNQHIASIILLDKRRNDFSPVLAQLRFHGIALSSGKFASADIKHDDIGSFRSFRGEDQIHIAGGSQHNLLFFADRLYRPKSVPVFRRLFKIHRF